ncbi:MAG: hypothetical protein PHW63_09905 [Alphaproteobacteria bacterium]|nr:hypothetical protein [Alphaproteobacteria bacterium]
MKQEHNCIQFHCPNFWGVFVGSKETDPAYIVNAKTAKDAEALATAAFRKTHKDTTFFAASLAVQPFTPLSLAGCAGGLFSDFVGTNASREEVFVPLRNRRGSVVDVDKLGGRVVAAISTSLMLQRMTSRTTMPNDELDLIAPVRVFNAPIVDVHKQASHLPNPR